MNKPKSLRMKLHEITYAPEYIQAYPADEMNEYIDELKALLAEMIKWAEQYEWEHSGHGETANLKVEIAKAKALLGKK